MWKGRSSPYAAHMYKFSCISVYKRPDSVSHLEPKHVAVTKLIKLSAVCDWFNIYTRTYDLLRMAARNAASVYSTVSTFDKTQPSDSSLKHIFIVLILVPLAAASPEFSSSNIWAVLKKFLLEDIFALLGRYAALWVVSYQRFGTTSRSYLQG
jgi:hypothetical protein